MQEHNLAWLWQLYEDTRQHWQKAGRDPSGYAIFYSPVMFEPELLIIGYNPGGSAEDFDEQNVSIPLRHEYTYQDYALAKKMRAIFDTPCLKKLMDSSIKFNLHYFRSANERSLQTNEKLNSFFYTSARQIIDRLQPRMIVTEGFKTFEKVISILKGSETTPHYLNNRKILRTATYESKLIFGLLHPTGCRGISKQILSNWSTLIEQHYKQISNTQFPYELMKTQFGKY